MSPEDDRTADERVPWTQYPPYWLFRGFCGAVRILPDGCVYRIAVGLARIACALDRGHRRVALANLEIAFGASKSDAEKRAIVRGSYRNLFLTMAEFILTPKIQRRGVPFIRMFDMQILMDALSKGKGILLLISHFGNWETMATWTPEVEGRVAAVGRPSKNLLIYREVERLRTMNNLAPMRKKWAVREIIDLLKRNWLVAVLADQYAGRDAPFVPFFGRPVSTNPVVPLLALKTGAAVIPAFDVRVRYGYHEVYVCPPIEIPDTGDREADVAEGCARINRVVEEWVRRYPDHWLWMARRWRRKKKPGER